MVQRTALADDHDRAAAPSPARPRPMDARRRQRRSRRLPWPPGDPVPWPRTRRDWRGAARPTAPARPAGERRGRSPLRACSSMPKRTDARTGYVTSGCTTVIDVTGLAPPLEEFGPADLFGEPGRCRGGELADPGPRSLFGRFYDALPHEGRRPGPSVGRAADVVCGAARPADDLEIRRERHGGPG